MKCCCRGWRHSRRPARKQTSASKRPFHAPKTHPPEADLSIVVGTGPWEGLTVHELFAQSFIAACSPDFLAENPIEKYADLNGKTLLLHEERRDAWERWAVGLGIPPIQPNRLVRLDTMSAVVLAAEQGVGVALVPSRLSADRFAAGGLVKLFDAKNLPRTRATYSCTDPRTGSATICRSSPAGS